MPVTFKNIERKAEVSDSTVSRALKNNVAIARETVEWIHRLMRKLSRVTSCFARSLKISCPHMLGIIAHRVADSFYSKLQGGLENVAYTSITGSLIFTSPYRNELGLCVPVVFIHCRAVEILLHSIYYDDVNGMSIETAFT